MAINHSLREGTKEGQVVVQASRGSYELTPRETEIVALASKGATDKEIADRLDLNVAALRTSWNRIRDKLGAVNRTHAIALSTVDRPMSPSGDVRTRLIDTLFKDKVASWVWQPRARQALLDGVASRLFCLPEGEAPVVLYRLLAHVWAPDRARFERFLIQGYDLRAMTPIELRVGVPGDYRTLIRTVNLASDTAHDPSLLLASTTIHVFPS